MSAGYIEPRRETDKCSWCYQYKYEAIPRFEAALSTIVSKLESLYPDYFKYLKGRPVFQTCSDNAVQKVKMYKQYIDKHVSECPTPTSVNAWKLGLAAGVRFQLHAEEARAVRALSLHQSILKDYDWHRAGNQRQGPFLRRLLAAPPSNERVLLSDWKAYFDLPCGALTTTQMEFATSQKAVSIFGAVNVCWTEDEKLSKTWVIFITEVLDHTAEATNIMLGEALIRIPIQPWETRLHLISDGGRHCVPKENAAFALHDLPKKLKGQ